MTFRIFSDTTKIAAACWGLLVTIGLFVLHIAFIEKALIAAVEPIVVLEAIVLVYRPVIPALLGGMVAGLLVQTYTQEVP